MLGFFKRKGAVGFDADACVHRLYRNRQSGVYKKVVRTFPAALTAGNAISRKKLGRIVFSDQNALRRLEKITHPYVISELRRWAGERTGKDALYVAEIPLLFEKKLDIICDKIILVHAPKSILTHRIKAKYGITSRQALKRLNLFIPWKEKEKRADFIIDNAADLRNLNRKAGSIWRKLKKML